MGGFKVRMFELRVAEVLQEELRGVEILSGITYRESASSEPHEEVYRRLLA